MGLFLDTIDVGAISEELRESVYRWFRGRIQIVDPNISETVYDKWTNIGGDSQATILWEGIARIQPIRTPLDAREPMGETTIAAVRFQIPIEAMGGAPIRKGLRVVITDPGEDPSLVHYQYVVRRAINSSMAWNRTIECEMDGGSSDGS